MLYAIKILINLSYYYGIYTYEYMTSWDKFKEPEPLDKK